MSAGGALLVAGTSSDAGKSMLVAGICRMLRRQGVRVAPFKAQNMSNNSVVTSEGGEIGRAQGMQARACGLAPSTRFNPILLKPGDDHRSHLVVRGKPFATVSAHEWSRYRETLRDIAVSELAAVRGEFDAVICEGAGSPAEINLRESDIANLGLARAADLPVIVVGDIDRGGVLAHLFGTLAVLEPEDQRLISAFVINKFRGAESLLRPGMADLTERTGRPVLGVVPFRDEVWLEAEDSLGTLADRPVGRPGPAVGAEWLTVAAIRLPRVSNTADVEALACEAGVAVRWVDNPSRLVDADVVVIPGTRATVADLAWLRSRGFAEVLARRAEMGRPILGICGGYQMLGRTIVDTVESGAGNVAGLGLLDMDVEFTREKTVGETRVHGAAGSATAGIPADGYEMHHGRVVRSGEASWLLRDRQGPTPEGSRGPAVWGTHLHGVLESDDFRRAWLTEVARCAGRSGFVLAPDTSVSALRESQIDLLADLVERHLDTTALRRLLDHGAPAQLPVLETRLRAATPVVQGR